MEIAPSETLETSTNSDADTGVVLPSSSSENIDWVGLAVAGARRRLRRIRRELPVWLPASEPTESVSPRANAKAADRFVLEAQRWNAEWRRRDWEELREFIYVEKDYEDTTNPIFRQSYE